LEDFYEIYFDAFELGHTIVCSTKGPIEHPYESSCGMFHQPQGIRGNPKESSAKSA
jgi:hypothetical protein